MSLLALLTLEASAALGGDRTGRSLLGPRKKMLEIKDIVVNSKTANSFLTSYGTWQDEHDKSSCKKCAAGKILKKEEQISDTCEECIVGLYNPNVGHDESCLPCPTATNKGTNTSFRGIYTRQCFINHALNGYISSLKTKLGRNKTVAKRRGFNISTIKAASTHYMDGSSLVDFVQPSPSTPPLKPMMALQLLPKPAKNYLHQTVHTFILD